MSRRQMHSFLVQTAKFVIDSEHRALSRICRIPRYRVFTTDLLGNRLTAVDSSSFVNSYAEIFKREIYRFPAGTDSPNILDCGANIGLSVIYFKRLYPASRITAFEADPGVFEVLSKNVATFDCKHVTLHNKAIWNHEGVLEFSSEGADAGRVSQLGNGNAPKYKVDSVRLRSFLQAEKVDLLKMDIEGAETVVLKDCADCLANVEQLFVEYHSFQDQSQSLHELLSILSEAGFRVYAQPTVFYPQPLVKLEPYLGMDMRLNIFASRLWG